MKPVLILFVIVVVPAVLGEPCQVSYSCAKSYQTTCGWFWGSSSCIRYRTGTCYKECKHGGWSDWSESCGACSVTCGEGIIQCTDTRTCSNPAPENGGRDCVGPTSQSRNVSCNNQPCPVNGGWGSWTEETCVECSMTCGGGTQSCTKTRECNNPAPAHGGQNCEGLASDTRIAICNDHHCPINGGWGSWTEETCVECSMTCGGGTQNCTKTRECNNPAPDYGGQNCEGLASDTRIAICNDHQCPINGGWGSWTEETCVECSMTCGGGTQNCTKIRECNNPAPAHGGQNCEGLASDSRIAICNDHQCPINGGWGSWTEETCVECSMTCGGGTQNCTKTRECNNPAPAHGGQNCEGLASDTRNAICNDHHCPIDGGWSSWSEWTNTTCSKDCCTGHLNTSRQRTCNKPLPQYGGKDCDGSDIETVYSLECNTHVCPINCDAEGSFHPHPCSNCTGSYYVCQFEDDTGTKMNCSEGLNWNHETKTCTWLPECNGVCTDGDRILDPEDTTCTKYIQCNNGQQHHLSCPQGTLFDSTTKHCEHAHSVECPSNTADEQGQETSSTAGTTATTSAPCTHGEFSPHTTDCQKYHQCVNGELIEHSCPDGLHWNNVSKVCDWEWNAGCS